MEHIHRRVRSLVFLDALLDAGGETVLDVVPADLARAIPEAAAREGEGWYLPTSDASFYGVSDPADAAWVNSKLTAQPLRAYTEPLVSNERAWSHPGAFIELRPSQTTPRIWRERRSAARPMRRLTTVFSRLLTTRWSPRPSS